MSTQLNLDDPVLLTTQLIDIPSVSHNETLICDIIFSALTSLKHLTLHRHGNTIVASTHFGHSSRIILSGHIDTVPIADNIPAKLTEHEGESTISGLGAVDMKSGDAVFLHLAKTLTNPTLDITYIFYDCEEVESQHNGLGKLQSVYPELLTADLAILGEPSNAGIEAGCQGALRGNIVTQGVRAHAARSWLGDNAIHALSPVLSTLAAYTPLTVRVDGLEYRESFSATKISGGIAGNVIPDQAIVEFNYRFSPDKDAAAAREYVQKFFAPNLSSTINLNITDITEGALPGLHHPVTMQLIDAAGGQVSPKYGWTDVSRFSKLGIPAVNLGPGNPSLAHKPEEYVPIKQITEVTRLLTEFLQ